MWNLFRHKIGEVFCTAAFKGRLLSIKGDSKLGWGWMRMGGGLGIA